MNVTFLHVFVIYLCPHNIWVAVWCQSLDDETEELQEDRQDEDVEDDDDQSSKQNSTPKRQLNR